MLIDDDPGLQPHAAINGKRGDDVLPGTDEDDVIDGKGGNDEIGGFGGNDRLIGGRGNDFMRGHGGDDRLEGDAGKDRLEGNGGDDRISGGGRADQISGGAGDDDLDGGSGGDTISGGRGNDVIRGGDGADTLSGDAGKDVIRGQEGADRLEGNGGADRLVGGDDDDVLLGGKAKDRLFGNGGDDLLDGGKGKDILKGGDGQDVFHFGDPKDGPDKITDFVQNVDRLDLSDLLPDFAAGDVDRVRFDIADGNTLISVDTDGDGAEFVAIAELVGVETDSLGPTDLGLPSNLPTSPEVVSIDGGGGEGGDPVGNVAFLPDLSANGRYVSFSAGTVGDDGAITDDFDLYRKDLETGDLTLVSTGDAVGGTGEGSAVSADGDTIVFSEFFPSNTIVIASLDGGDLDGVGDGEQPSISDDGARAAFDGAGGVVVAGDLDLTIGGAGGGSISPDGDFVAFVRGGGGLAVRSLADGSDIDVPDTAGASDPVVSAGGRYVAYEDGGEIFRVDLQDPELEPQPVSDDVAGDARTPSISNAGNLIAFQSGDDVFVKDMDSGELQTIARTGDASEIPDGLDWLTAPSIAGNGTLVAYVDGFDFDPEVGLTSGEVIAAPVDFGGGEAALASLITPSDVVA